LIDIEVTHYPSLIFFASPRLRVNDCSY
jgi:hypothetical protein